MESTIRFLVLKSSSLDCMYSFLCTVEFFYLSVEKTGLKDAYLIVFGAFEQLFCIFTKAY